MDAGWRTPSLITRGDVLLNDFGIGSARENAEDFDRGRPNMIVKGKRKSVQDGPPDERKDDLVHLTMMPQLLDGGIYIGHWR